VNVKATSMHQKSELNHSKYISPDVYHPRPVQSHPLKVNFIYPQHENSKIGTKTI